MIKLKKHYDVIVIGSGSSGSACAIRCAQLGLITLCIDNLQQGDNHTLQPGIISNPWCLEIITMLKSAKFYDAVVNDLNAHGIYADNISLNLAQMIRHKDNIFANINQTIKKEFTVHNVDFIHANAKLIQPKAVEIKATLESSINIINAEHIVLATESIPISVTCAPIDNEYIFDSSAALNLKQVPKRLAILGAGVMGLELAAIWNRLGSETILLDAQESFLDITDNHISREAYKIFTSQGLELRLGTRIISTKIVNKKVLIEYQDSDGMHGIKVDKLFVASGRRPNSENLAAPEANLLLDENGFVHINENYRTNLPNVYAIGDLTLLGPMLTHKGISEGEFVAEQIAGLQGIPINYKFIPNIIHTEPEIAWVGQTEQALKAIGYLITISESSLALANHTKAIKLTAGVVKIITCTKSDTILGIHIISSFASELIAEAVLALEFSASSEDIARIIQSHPSSAEALRIASMSIKHNQNFSKNQQ
jgi:dihydrolipoamide dehydrogenase